MRWRAAVKEHEAGRHHRKEQQISQLQMVLHCAPGELMTRQSSLRSWKENFARMQAVEKLAEAPASKSARANFEDVAMLLAQAVQSLPDLITHKFILNPAKAGELKVAVDAWQSELVRQLWSIVQAPPHEL
jgi:hypothetical protein